MSEPRELERDYKEVRDSVLRELSRKNYIEPVRSHEIAFMVGEGLKERGYNDVRVETGVYVHNNGREKIHSWVRVNGVIIDFQFRSKSRFNPDGVRYWIWEDRILPEIRVRKRFKKKNGGYTLSIGIEDLSRDLFPLAVA